MKIKQRTRAPYSADKDNFSIMISGRLLHFNMEQFERTGHVFFGGVGWRGAYSAEAGVSLKWVDEHEQLVARSNPHPTDEYITIALLKEHLRNQAKVVQASVDQTRSALEEKHANEMRKMAKQLRTAEQKRAKAEARTKDAEAERDHAQAHVRKICSELLKRDEYQHAKRYLKQQLRKRPDPPAN
jgi:hypothetical protein